MGLEVRITGARDLANLRRQLTQLGDKGLGKKLAKGLQNAGRPLRTEIAAEAEATLPSGYGPLLSRSLQFRQTTRASRQEARVAFRIHADGAAQRRDLPQINRGVLRHPVFGRRRRLKSGRVQTRPWVAQRVRAGVVDRPAERLQPAIRREIDAVVRDIADQITRG